MNSVELSQQSICKALFVTSSEYPCHCCPQLNTFPFSTFLVLAGGCCFQGAGGPATGSEWGCPAPVLPQGQEEGVLAGTQGEGEPPDRRCAGALLRNAAAGRWLCWRGRCSALTLTPCVLPSLPPAATPRHGPEGEGPVDEVCVVGPSGQGHWRRRRSGGVFSVAPPASALPVRGWGRGVRAQETLLRGGSRSPRRSRSPEPTPGHVPATVLLAPPLGGG